MDFETNSPMLARVIESSSARLRGEIVRCRDCVFFIADVSTVDVSGNVIATGNTCDFTALWVKPDDYCSWGERKVDA